ncbi:MAG TPA: ribosome biogenesis GTPase Der [Candidatus Azoamicus sp. OHIO1]
MDKIVILGKKNVGKSSLFNVLTKTKNSLVTNHMGYTRDRKCKLTKIKSTIYSITDTAGIGYENEETDFLSLKQTWIAIKESTIILYMFEANAKINYIDVNIINILKKLGKKIIFIINKIDLLNQHDTIFENEKLKFKTTTKISIKQNIGINKLLSEIETNSSKNSLEDNIKINNNYKIAILGRPNVGKSSLVNKITNSNRTIVHSKPGTTRDSIHVDLNINKKNYIIVDTAGIKYKKKLINDTEKIAIKQSFESINNSNMSILVIDIIDGITKQDLNLLRYSINIGKPVIIAINKSDLIEKKKLKETEKIIKIKLKFAEFITYHFISSKYGFGIKNLTNKISFLNNFQNIKYSSTYLKNIIKIIESKKCYTEKTKFYYANVIKYEPLTINIFANKEKISINYKKYILGSLIKKLKLINIPIKINIKKITLGKNKHPL